MNSLVQNNPYRVKWRMSITLISEGRYSEKIYGESFGFELQDHPPITLLSSEFKKLFNHIYPLGPTRVHPKRLYHWEGTNPDSVGQTGEDMIASLLNARVDQRTTPYEGQNVPIEERISWWLQEMDLGYSFSIKRTSTGKDRDYDVLIQKAPNSAKVTLADMGYGLGQFLPVLVHMLLCARGIHIDFRTARHPSASESAIPTCGSAHRSRHRKETSDFDREPQRASAKPVATADRRRRD